MRDGSAILEVDKGKRDRRAEHRRKWYAAQRVREGWSEADFEEEAERLQAEIEARIAAGEVTRCDPARVWVGLNLPGVDGLGAGIRAGRAARRAA
ncbi:MAG: hypothetical protein V4753_09870 [Pseudomonadota bacterium]